MKSADEVAKDAQPEEADSGGGGLGGLLGRKLAKKIVPAKDTSPRQTLLTSSVEVLSVSRDVAAADVALPAGYRRK